MGDTTFLYQAQLEICRFPKTKLHFWTWTRFIFEFSVSGQGAFQSGILMGTSKNTNLVENSNEIPMVLGSENSQ